MYYKNLINKFHFIGLLLTANISLGQYVGEDEIKPSQLSPWNSGKAELYSGVYGFGYSESESSLFIICDAGETYAQLYSGVWDEKNNTWLRGVRNLSSVSISGNSFYSDQFNGRFVVFNDGTEKHQGLQVLKSWYGGGLDEVGLRSSNINRGFYGDFPQASCRKLTYEELNRFSKEDLKIMRNEIFARYGYIFTPGGEMALYFSNKEWYSPQYKSVDKFLSPIEKHNIQQIKEAEKNR